MPENPFIVLVADVDPVVEAVSARLLSAALETQNTSFPLVVRVLTSQDDISNIHEPELPTEVRKIKQKAVSASAYEIENTKLIVGFLGVDEAKVNSLRNAGLSAPAVGLCQFVLRLDEIANEYVQQRNVDAQEVLVGAALQFGFGGGSTECAICSDKVGDSIDYWINIADTCSKFAQLMRKLQSQD